MIHESVTKPDCRRAACCRLSCTMRSMSLRCDRDVDLLIPRGSNAFVQYIMNNTKIPVMGHADGICHIYVDKDCDSEKAIPVIIDAKTPVHGCLQCSRDTACQQRDRR